LVGSTVKLRVFIEHSPRSAVEHSFIDPTTNLVLGGAPFDNIRTTTTACTGHVCGKRQLVPQGHFDARYQITLPMELFNAGGSNDGE
jgi:hypothetical protein